MNKPNYDRLPDHIRGGMQRYVEHGIEPGGFLTAVLENDLLGAFARADATCLIRMTDIVKFVNNELPGVSYGSPEAVNNWIELKKLERFRKAAKEAGL